MLLSRSNGNHKIKITCVAADKTYKFTITALSNINKHISTLINKKLNLST